MQHYLVIIESPYKAPAINSYLGKEYKVMASVGHVRDLPKSTLGVDTDHDFAVKYINIKGKSDIINQLKKEVKKFDKPLPTVDFSIFRKPDWKDFMTLTAQELDELHELWEELSL